MSLLDDGERGQKKPSSWVIGGLNEIRRRRYPRSADSCLNSGGGKGVRKSLARGILGNQQNRYFSLKSGGERGKSLEKSDEGVHFTLGVEGAKNGRKSGL